VKESLSKIIKFEGKKAGKTIAIFGGVHGNEPIGPMLLDELQKNLEIENGIVYLVYANPRAIEKSTRFIEKNLNRMFKKDNTGKLYEEKIAIELSALLDNCDALLDLHAFTQPEGEAVSFAICEPESYFLIKNLPVSFVVSGLHNFERGSTDQYMYFQNKPGVCIELGSRERPRDFLDLGRNMIAEFLTCFEMLPANDSIKFAQKTYLEVVDFYKKKHESFSFVKPYKNFDFVKASEIICFDAGEAYVAKKDSHIIFPREDVVVGEEAFILAEIKE
jgi:succinylglutamate desuccinylase